MVEGISLVGIGCGSACRQSDDRERIADAARQFEALLVAWLLRTAREASQEGWLGSGEDPTASSALELAEEQFAQALAAQGGLGLARLIAAGLDAGDAGPEL